MEKNAVEPGSTPAGLQAAMSEIAKELGQLRARLAEIGSTMRRTYGSESVEAALTEDVSKAVQRLEARLLGCPTAEIE